MMFEQGFFTIARWRGIPIRIHWSAFLGAAVFGRFEFVPAFWLGFFLLILVHELGHAFAVRRVGGQVLSVDVTGLGGLCAWRGEVTRIQRACVAWAGVWAQLVLLGMTLLLQGMYGPFRNGGMAQLADVFIRTNLWLMAINLLPVRPMDGAEAWRLLPLLWKRFMKRREERRLQRARAATRRELERRDALEAELDEPPAAVREAVRDILAGLKKTENTEAK